MPRCVVRYHAVLIPRRYPGVVLPEHEGIVRMEEWWEADEWGDPGQLLRSRFLEVEGARRGAWEQALRGVPPINWELQLLSRIGQVEWVEE